MQKRCFEISLFDFLVNSHDEAKHKKKTFIIFDTKILTTKEIPWRQLNVFFLLLLCISL